MTHRPDLLEVLDRVLDRGLVIDGWADISFGGITLLTVDVRIVVSSIATCLSYTRTADTPLNFELAAGPHEGAARDRQAAWPTPEAAVHAAEEYLRQLRPPKP